MISSKEMPRCFRSHAFFSGRQSNRIAIVCLSGTRWASRESARPWPRSDGAPALSLPARRGPAYALSYPHARPDHALFGIVRVVLRRHTTAVIHDVLDPHACSSRHRHQRFGRRGLGPVVVQASPYSNSSAPTPSSLVFPWLCMSSGSRHSPGPRTFRRELLGKMSPASCVSWRESRTFRRYTSCGAQF